MNDLWTWLQQLDRSLFHLINGGDSGGHSHGTSLIDSFMLFSSAKWPWAVLGAATVFFALRQLRIKKFLLLEICLLTGITIGITDLLTFRVLKPSFARPRPCYQLTDVNLMQPSCGSDFGMPSNHAANAMGAATVVALRVRRRWTFALFIAALFVGFSRIYLGAHFPGDVLVGFFVGTLVALGVYRLFCLWRARSKFYLKSIAPT
jgi:undecaprenyl-diphosphatase